MTKKDCWLLATYPDGDVLVFKNKSGHDFSNYVNPFTKEKVYREIEVNVNLKK